MILIYIFVPKPMVCCCCCYSSPRTCQLKGLSASTTVYAFKATNIKTLGQIDMHRTLLVLSNSMQTLRQIVRKSGQRRGHKSAPEQQCLLFWSKHTGVPKFYEVYQFMYFASPLNDHIMVKQGLRRECFKSSIQVEHGPPPCRLCKEDTQRSTVPPLLLLFLLYRSSIVGHALLVILVCFPFLSFSAFSAFLADTPEVYLTIGSFSVALFHSSNNVVSFSLSA